MIRWFDKALWFGAPPWAFALRAMLRASLRNQEQIMLDFSKLKDQIARLQASDTAALAALQTVRDQNVQLQAQLSNINVEDPTAQDQIDAMAAQAGQIADTVDQAVANNPNVPNLPGSTPSSGTTSDSTDQSASSSPAQSPMPDESSTPASTQTSDQSSSDQPEPDQNQSGT